MLNLLQVIRAMNDDAGKSLTMLKVDGGMSVSNPLLQFQADILGIDVGTAWGDERGGRK